MIPLCRRADRIGPGVCRVVERSGVEDGPVQEIAARIVGVFVGIEDIDRAEFSDRDDQPVRGLRSGKLVESSIDFLDLATEVDGLPQERAVQTRVGISGADLVGFAAREIPQRRPIRSGQSPDRFPD